MTHMEEKMVNKTAIIVAITDCPGSTAAEIAAALKAQRHDVAAALPEIADGGAVIVRGGPRVCAVSHRPAVTWFPVTLQ